MLELVGRNDSYNDRENVDNGERIWNTRIFSRTVVGVIISLVSIGLFLGGYYLGVGAYRHSRETYIENEPSEADARFQFKALPAVEWSGVCPKKAAKCPESFQNSPPLLIISLDGFHPDYVQRGFNPTLKNLARCGASAEFMYPVFPSKTFPNHYSQVTGLNPPTHGIIDNSMYDPTSRKMFKIGSAESLKEYWWKREPIWITAEKQGKKSGCYFWPGSEVRFNGIVPTYVKKYSSKAPFESRVDQVLDWLDLPVADRPSFLTLYVNQPDNAAHHFGMNSKEVNDALVKVDNMIDRLYSGLQQRQIVDCVNIMIMSDHGMAQTDCSRVIDLRDYINVTNVFSTVGPIGRIRPKGPRNITAIREMVSQLSCKSDNMRAYAKEQLPIRMHFADSDRIEPIFLDIDAGWTITTRGVQPNDQFCTGGSHGYDNFFPEMRAIFMAHGPSFKKNVTIKPFITTELYELMTELISIKGNPNNGTKGSLHHVLKNPQTLSPQQELDPPMIAAVPSDETEYNFRVSAANCSCKQTSKQMDITNITEHKATHLPHGIPYVAEDNSTLRLLVHEDYVSAFDLKYRLPLWTSYTLTGLKNASKLEDICWTGDARIHISDSPQCKDFTDPRIQKLDVQQRPLYPHYFSLSPNHEQANFITNSVPKSSNYTKIIERKLYQVLGDWAAEESQLNVVTGPAFDYSATGIRPSSGSIMSRHGQFGSLLVPTHYFTIATWCKSKTSKSCNPSQLEATAFLLPNSPYPKNCEPAATVISKNRARVVDIEKLTGISFFTGLPIYEAIRLRTAVPERVPS